MHWETVDWNYNVHPKIGRVKNMSYHDIHQYTFHVIGDVNRVRSFVILFFNSPHPRNSYDRASVRGRGGVWEFRCPCPH